MLMRELALMIARGFALGSGALAMDKEEGKIEL
jgi:hypothetical protein